MPSVSFLKNEIYFKSQLTYLLRYPLFHAKYKVKTIIDFEDFYETNNFV